MCLCGRHAYRRRLVTSKLAPRLLPPLARLNNMIDKVRGDPADRLIAALEAAEGEGGDIRGRQSAALLVVKA